MTTQTLLDENRDEFIELLSYKASVETQISYNRKEDYFLLMDKYLTQSIPFSEFKTGFLKMENQDSEKAGKILQDFQQLSLFSLVENLEEFSDSITRISSLCMEMYALKESGETLSKNEKNEIYNSVKNLCFQLKKSFEE